MDDNLFAGFISGIAQTIVGHPLDTIKVWRQQNIQRSQKLSSIFSGMKYPLCTAPIVASIQFKTSAYVSSGIRDVSTFTSVQCDAIGGLFAGIISAIATSPIDKYKIQMQTKSNKSRYGLSSCILREVPACGIYFGSYSALREQGQSVLISGGIAGTLSWLFTYPLDIIKTQMQSGESPNIRTTYNKMRTGQISLSKGLGVCLVRAFLINGVGFTVYENCLCIANP